jgi:hypothetical protein
MNNFRSIATVVAIAILASVGAANGVVAQEGRGIVVSPLAPVKSLNCADFAQRETALDTLRFYSFKKPKTKDPVSATERFGEGPEPYMLTGFTLSNDGSDKPYLGCILMLVRLEVKDLYEVDRHLDLEFGNQSYEYLPILLVDRFRDGSAFEARKDAFRLKNYSIPVLIEDFIEDGNAGFVSEWSDNNLWPIRFFDPDGPRAAIPAPRVDLYPLSDASRYFGEVAGSSIAPVAIRVCGIDCDLLQNSGAGQGGAAPAPRGDILAITPPPESAPAPVNTPGIIVEFRKESGEVVSTGFDTQKELACLVIAMSPELFTPASAVGCNPKHRALIQSSNPVIEVGADGIWTIVAQGEVAPERLIVTLPDHVDGSGCFLDFSVGNSDPAFLEPIANTDPAQFSADVSTILTNINQKTEFEITVSDPVGCGGESRSFSVPAAKVIEVNLNESRVVKQGVVHLLTLNGTDLEFATQLPRDSVDAFGRAVVDAIESAHKRLEQSLIDMPSHLTYASVEQANQNRRPEQLLELGAGALKSQITGRFENITISQRQAIAAHNVTLDGSLNTTLEQVAGQTGQQGIEQTTVNLIGFSRNQRDACDPYLYSGQNGGVRINAFPVVRLNKRDAPDLTLTIPVQGAASLFGSGADRVAPVGGLYSCVGMKEGVHIYPFFVEAWRPGRDITPRYASALSDKLFEILFNAATSGEVK